jgi:hypothetical protein
MHVIKVRNVSQALVEGALKLKSLGVERNSRNGKVLVLPGPLATTYRAPQERVLFDPRRDANPFFHFMEALWMIHGGRDVAWPLQFNSKFGSYSDDGVVFNGAYGHRWRHHFGADQLRSIINSLRENPDCRRQVLSMWDGSRDLGSQSKDIPCNLSATLQIGVTGALDMMVSNRSNDLIWGAYGANAVHFSMLQEFLAAAIGVPVGTYTQVSANTHVYEPHWGLMDYLAARAPMPPEEFRDHYSLGLTVHSHMVNITPNIWERELDTFMKLQHRSAYRDPFFELIAKPMFMAYISFKERSNPSRFENARDLCRKIIAVDWSRACIEWLDRREEAAKERV